MTGGAAEPLLLGLLNDPDEYVRAWSIQLLCESRTPSDAALTAFGQLARDGASPLVRLYLASAMQRTPIDKRRSILESLISREGDATDHNLPLMYWFALEPVVGQDASTGLALLDRARIPLLRQFITRRLASEDLLAGR